MKKTSIAFLFSILTAVSFSPAEAVAGKYWVFFTDKQGVHFDPYAYFDAKAIQRRIVNDVPLSDFTDWPVREDYVRAVSLIADSVTYATRWFNALAVYGSCAQLDRIDKLPFVKNVAEMAARASLAATTTSRETGEGLTDKLLARQLERFGAEHFFSKGIDGSGVRIAILDAGFPTVDENLAFEHIRKDKRIIKTWDFVAKRENVYAHSSHGMMVMSCIGGMLDREKIGMATGAEFLLARTEMSKREPFSEEENWLAAVEWADKNGAQIINSSLGYTFNRYFTTEMDGHTSLVAKAANMAASKGILVVNAAGNDGRKEWKIIGTPADADSVLAVGGISPFTGYHIGFSSYGPTSDKRMKPNVCAFGTAVVAGKKFLEIADGTSFASPLVAGFAACALQMNQGMKTMDLFHAIEQSADLYPYFDYAHGYGVPQAAYFTAEAIQAAPTFEIQSLENSLVVQIISDEDVMKEIRANSGAGGGVASYNTVSSPPHYMYYHIEDKNGVIERYYVINLYSEVPIKLNPVNFRKGEKLVVHFRGYTSTHNF